jgi:hypothetical protein
MSPQWCPTHRSIGCKKYHQPTHPQGGLVAIDLTYATIRLAIPRNHAATARSEERLDPASGSSCTISSAFAPDCIFANTERGLMDEPVTKFIVQLLIVLLGGGGGGILYQVYMNRKLKAESTKLNAESTVLLGNEGYRQLEITVGLISNQLAAHAIKLSEVHNALDIEREARRALELRVSTLITALVEMWNGLVCLTRQLEEACIPPKYIPSKRITRLMADFTDEQGDNNAEEVSSLS